MLRLENDRSCLYQWDVDQRLEVDNDEIREVHFANAVTSPALVCEVYEKDGRRFADVPNILLQQIWPIHAYGFCGSRVRDVFTCRVIRRERPADYVYTETEVKRFDDLEKRVEYLEQYGGGAGGSGGPGPAGPQGEPGKDGKDGKSAYQYAQDGGYTGTEEEFARKLAQEIPDAYTLPPATTETLGGVIVGEGLNVDEDGRVGVKPEGEFELIETITINEGEELSSIVRNTEPSGSSYDFSHIYIDAYTPQTDGDKIGVVNINGGTAAYYSRFTATGARGRANKAIGRIENGMLRVSAASSAKGSGQLVWESDAQVYEWAFAGEFADNIKYMSITMLNGAIFPAGTIISIYGVRRNA